MSILVMSMVYATKLGGANRKAVALKLADHARDDGTRVYPSLSRIADETEVSKSTVQRSIRELLAMGVLSVVKRGGAGPKATTEYRFNLDKLSGLKKVVTVTTSEPAKVVNGDKKGSHRDHRSIIEPLKRSFEPVLDDRRSRPASVHRFVSEDALDRVKGVAPGWDRQALLRKFTDWPGSKNASNLDQAFIGWAKSFTKGRVAA